MKDKERKKREKNGRRKEKGKASKKTVQGIKGK